MLVCGPWLAVSVSHPGQVMIYLCTDHLDHLQWVQTCRCEMLCRICIVQIRPRKHVLDHVDFTVSTRQYELLINTTDQESICSEISRSCIGSDLSDLSHVLRSFPRELLKKKILVILSLQATGGFPLGLVQ